MCFHVELKERPDIYPGVWSFSNFALVSNMFICSSINEAVAWLQFHGHIYLSIETLSFFDIGSVPYPYHAEFIQTHAPTKKLHFIFSKDDEGALCDLKLASYIRKKPLKITYDNHTFHITFEHTSYQLHFLSLNALEKASGYNFRIRTHKPKRFITFYEQLRHRHHP